MRIELDKEIIDVRYLQKVAKLSKLSLNCWSLMKHFAVSTDCFVP